MERLFQSLSQYQAQILCLTLLMAVVALAIGARSLVGIRRHRQQWGKLLQGARGENLEQLLMDALRDNMALQDRLAAAEGRIGDLEKRMEKAKRHLGVVRFDAFEEVGGNQSFALALYDDNGDGAVLNSLVGRNDCRVYAKPLVGGRSDRNLSQEERRAIEEAITRAPKSIATERV